MASGQVRALMVRLHAAERALGYRDQLLAMIAHELRTPAHAVLGWSTVLEAQQRAGKAGSASTRAVAAIGRNAQLQLRLLNDLVDRALLDRRQLRLELASIDLADVVAGALEATKPAASAKRLTLAADLDGSLPMRGDAGRLEQVLLNLLSNAVKFSPPRGRVGLSAHRRNGSLELAIVDSGPGIEASLLPVIFQPFQRGQLGDSSLHGLGLGLSIAKSIVELHGGSIRAQNAETGHGAMFTVVLPAAERRFARDRARKPRRRAPQG